VYNIALPMAQAERSPRDELGSRIWYNGERIHAAPDSFAERSMHVRRLTLVLFVIVLIILAYFTFQRQPKTSQSVSVAAPTVQSRMQAGNLVG
jgi:uncharacterized membrane protein affecting hemolysin expression